MNEPVAREAYERLADAFAAHVDTKPHNALYERPATQSLLPEVHGQRVLDIGCGPGAHAQWLIEHGATVVGVDLTERMLEHARARLGPSVELHCADIGAPMPFLPDASFDGVLAPLVLDYVSDWSVPMAEFFRVLEPGGWLVFSLEHPSSEFSLRHAKQYLGVEQYEVLWRGFGVDVVVPTHHRPWQDVLNPLSAASFMLDRVLEPLPLPEFEAQDPEDWERSHRVPGFLCIRARKR